MAPIKIKLSLGSAGIQPSGEAALDFKGKGKEPASTPVQQAAPSTAETPNVESKASSTWAPTGEPPSAGPSRLPYEATEQKGSSRASPSGLLGSPIAYETPTRSAKAPKLKGSSAKSKGRPKVASKKQTKRPSAIPTRLLSSGPSTPKPPAPVPLADTPPPGDEIVVKVEEGDSPAYDSPSTPQPDDTGTAEYGTPYPSDYGTPVTGQKQSARWMKIKRPLRELATKIVADLVRRDEYDLFGEPVDLEAYPDYLKVVGGEEKMMDLGTMQNKIDNEEYPSFAEFQADLEKLADAAKTFNPVGTVPHNAAIKLFNQGMKQIERSRDLVLTPPPSRAGSKSRWRDGSAQSGREMTALTEDGPDGDSLRKSDVPPDSYIPEEMLDYPPNSTAAKLVGWNLNGGKRVYAKRVTRGREKFIGKWRHWDLDGSRDVAEMDEPDQLFELAKARRGESLRSVTDWMEMRKEAWWEHEGLGGANGQPPLPGTALPKRVEMKEKEILPTDLGVYRDIGLELKSLRYRQPLDDKSLLLPMLDASTRKSGPPGPSNFTNIFERPQGRRPVDYVRELQTGGTIGEAYMRSVERFVHGAVAGRAEPVKHEDEEGMHNEDEDLERWITDLSSYGLLRPTTETRSLVQSTLESLDRLRIVLAAGEEVPPDLEWIYARAKQAYGRSALHVLTDNRNSLEIAPLIRQPTEFQWTGIGGKGDIPIGLKWVSTRMEAHNEHVLARQSKKRSLSLSPMDDADVKRLKVEDTSASRGSSPLSAAPDSPVKADAPPLPPGQAGGVMAPTTFDSVTDYDDGEGGLKRIRLELLALTKFYPLAALRKMDKASAAKLLPANVQALMTKP